MTSYGYGQAAFHGRSPASAGVVTEGNNSAVVAIATATIARNLRMIGLEYFRYQAVQPLLYTKIEICLSLVKMNRLERWRRNVGPPTRRH